MAKRPRRPQVSKAAPTPRVRGRRQSVFDAVLKDAATRDLAALLGLADLRIKGPITLLSTELRLARRPDLVAKVIVEGAGVCIVNPEFERSPRRGVLARLYVYGAMLYAEYGLPVISILVIASDGPNDELLAQASFGSARIDVYILRLRDHPTLASNPLLAELALLTVPPGERAMVFETAAATLLAAEREEQLENLVRLGRALGLPEATFEPLEVEMSVRLEQARVEGRVEGRVEFCVEALRALGVLVQPDQVALIAALSPLELAALLRAARPGVSLGDLLAARSGS